MPSRIGSNEVQAPSDEVDRQIDELEARLEEDLILQEHDDDPDALSGNLDDITQALLDELRSVQAEVEVLTAQLREARGERYFVANQAIPNDRDLAQAERELQRWLNSHYEINQQRQQRNLNPPRPDDAQRPDWGNVSQN